MKDSENTNAAGIFRPLNIIYTVVFLLIVLAVFSHDAQDLAVLDGGMDAPYRNLIGFGGAYLARLLFFAFGLAVYPLLGVAVFSRIRHFLPVDYSVRKGYTGAFLLFTLGMVILAGSLANIPEFLKMTNTLGIGRFSPEAVIAASSMTGGLPGMLLAAPEVPGPFSGGLLPAVIGKIGTLIVAWACILPSLFYMAYSDWKDVFLLIFTPAEDRPEKKTVSKVQEMPAPAMAAVKEETEKEDDLPPFDADPVVSEPAAAEKIPENAPAVQEKESPEESGKGFFSKLFGKKGKDQPSNPFAAVQAPVQEQPDPEDDDYVILPPRPVGSSQGQPAQPQSVFSAPAQPPAPETLPRLDQPAPERETPVRQSVPVRETPLETPVGIQPAIHQFADQKVKPSSALQPVQNSALDYELPYIKMLDQHNNAKSEDSGHLEASRERLQQTLDSFSVAGHVENIVVGPRVTRFEVQLDEGVAVSKVTAISNNIAMKMQAESVRILAPIPGRDAVGIEVPNKNSSIVYIRAVMEDSAWRESKADIPIVLGRDVEGKAIVTNLAKAPHLLIAGSTGSGKSVCMNTLIMSLLFKFSPDDLRLILVDPKVVEMEAYSTIPHLITPVVNDPKKVPLALRWGVNEMERRYRQMAKVHAKDLKTFNARPKDPVPMEDEDGKIIPQKMPYLIIIIDELADIMMTEARKDVENSIARIAQKGRAAGVHLVIATQTPRKDIITGVIKANLPVKIAFKVASNMDSRVILDQGGAEKLLGRGDLLFNPPGASNLERIQMTLVTDDEIHRIVDFCSSQVEQHFNADVLAENVEIQDSNDAPAGRQKNDDEEEWEEEFQASPEMVNSVAAKYLQPGDSDLLRQALELIINERQASTSFFQRRLGIGYNKSAELVDKLEQRNIISKPLGGGQKRDILILDGLEIAE